MQSATLPREPTGLKEELVSLRRHFHQYPELGFEEKETSSFIAGYLRNLGLEVGERVGKTGVTGLLRGARGGQTLLYRADMDALRVREDNDIPYRSRQEGVAHACGHDAHMALALMAAKLLNGMKDEIAGNVKFIFQPNEELAPGGAQLMIAEGLGARCEADVTAGYPPLFNDPDFTGVVLNV